MTQLNEIPTITDPLGEYWSQPRDIQLAPMDDTHVILTAKQLHDLSEYSASMPTGVYEGKCWKWREYKRVRDVQSSNYGRLAETGRWQLRWYGPCDDPKMVSNNKRWVILM